MTSPARIKRLNPLSPLSADEAIDVVGRFDSDGTELHNGRNQVRSFATPKGCVAVKRFGRPNIFRLGASLIKGTKGEEAFDKAMAISSRAIATPFPWALLEADGREYLLCDFTPAPPLLDFLESDPADGIAEAFADFSFGVHERGILHRDYNNTNIRVDFAPGSPARFSLIDVNRAIIFPHGEKPSRRERLDNLHLFSENTDFYRRVLRRYLYLLGEKSDAVFATELALKNRHDTRWRQKKTFTKSLKALFLHGK